MVFIRTDANEKVATGHIMRCITIGKKLEEMGERVCFLLKDKDSLKVLNGQMQYQMLQGCGEDIYEEIPQIIAFLKKERRPKILLDSYEFDGKYMQGLKEHGKVISFDDMFWEKIPADMIINYNLYASKDEYASRYAGEKTVLLLGSSYVPLRDEFAGKNLPLRKNVTTILLICGGGDQQHVLPKFLEKFCDDGLQKKYHILVLAGDLNQDKERLRQFAACWEKIRIYEGARKLAPIMEQADVVISAASTVLYECCALKRPVIFFTMADNQAEDAKTFGENGMMHYVGDIRKDVEQVIENVVEEIKVLENDIQIRSHMVHKMKQVVDGNGASRIARAIIDL